MPTVTRRGREDIGALRQVRRRCVAEEERVRQLGEDIPSSMIASETWTHDSKVCPRHSKRSRRDVPQGGEDQKPRRTHLGRSGETTHFPRTHDDIGPRSASSISNAPPR